MPPEAEPKKPQMPWTPEERSRLIHLREQNPDITWTEFNKKYPFPNRTLCSVFQYYRRIASEGVDVQPKKRRKTANGGGGKRRNTAKRGSYEDEALESHTDDDADWDWRDENMHDGEEGDDDYMEDEDNIQDEEGTSDEVGDISFNGIVEPFKQGSASTRGPSYSGRPVPSLQHQALYFKRKELRAISISPQFVAARTIHSTDPSPRIHLGMSNPVPPSQETSSTYPKNTHPIPNTRAPFMFVPNVIAQLYKNERSFASEENASFNKRLDELEHHVHSTLRERHAAWTEVLAQLEEVETFGSRLNNVEAAAVNIRGEMMEIKEHAKKMRQDTKKMQEDANKDRRALDGILTLFGNLKIMDLFKITGGEDVGPKVEPNLGGESDTLPAQTPESDPSCEHLRAWSG